MTEQAVTESAAIEPPSVGRRTTGSGSSYLISSGHWASSSFPSFSSLSKVGSSQTFGLLQAGLRDCSQPLPL